MSEDNSHETDVRNHWSSWGDTNRVKHRLTFEDGFLIAKRTDRNFLVTVPLEGLEKWISQESASSPE